MSDLAINLAKLAVVAALWGFLWVVLRSGARQLKSAGVRRRRILEITRSDSQAGAVVELRGTMVAGRSPDADLVLDDPYASDFHTRFALGDGEVRVNDLGSTNGTLVNGAPAEGTVTLAPGDAVQIGRTVLELR